MIESALIVHDIRFSTSTSFHCRKQHLRRAVSPSSRPGVVNLTVRKKFKRPQNPIFASTYERKLSIQPKEEIRVGYCGVLPAFRQDYQLEWILLCDRCEVAQYVHFTQIQAESYLEANEPHALRVVTDQE